MNINYKTYIRFFDEDKAIEYDGYIDKYGNDKRYTYSRYFPNSIKNILIDELITTGKIDHRQYIACPVYSDHDIQIGISGSAKVGETKFQTIKREVGEETGILVKNAKIRNSIVKVSNNREFTVAYANIEDCKHIPMSDDNKKINGDKQDLKEKRIYCLVYGDLDKLLEFFNEPNLARFYSDDKIVGVAILNIDKVLRDLP